MKVSECGELAGYLHAGFWLRMDACREMEVRNEMQRSGKVPWALRR